MLDIVVALLAAYAVDTINQDKPDYRPFLPVSQKTNDPYPPLYSYNPHDKR